MGREEQESENDRRLREACEAHALKAILEAIGSGSPSFNHSQRKRILKAAALFFGIEVIDP